METADEQSQARIFNGVVWTLLTLAGTAVLLLIAGALLMPFRGHGRSKQSEAKANLKAAFTAEKSFFREKDIFNADASVVGFGPERGNRYNYFLAPTGHVERRDKATAPQGPAQIIGADAFKFGEVAPVFWRWSDARCPTPAGYPGEHHVMGVSKDEFLITAASNIDNDSTLDCWSIASYFRRAPNGDHIPPGEPYNDQNDLANDDG